MKCSQRPAVVAVRLVASLLVLLTGCGVVSEPDATAWDQHAVQALTDAASQVATARLALEAAGDGRTWPTYTTVLVAEAEEAAGTAEEDLARLQVPPERADAAPEVLDLLGRAVDLVAEARAHAVAGTYDDRALLDALDRLSDDLRQAAP
ncbi:hypothetical protein [Pimelobacter simplex]|uniref:hypothetical protein n=1 Tax=Nocardioides simplex TaxID=2045 RepID=UPI001932D8F0|nr:hypothetical protein [Pimelobacter simplex]